MKRVLLPGLMILAAASAASAQCPPTTLDFRVVNFVAGPYTVNGVSRAPIQMIEGVTYSVNFPTGTGNVPSFHPWHFTFDTDGGGGVTAGEITTEQLPGYVPGNHCSSGCPIASFTCTPGPLTPTNFFYQCSTHLNIGGPVTIIRRPVFTQQPQPISTCKGQPVTLTAAATLSSGSPTYQWRKDGQDLSGETNPTLTFTITNASSLGIYDVRASNGTCAQAATLSDPALVSVCWSDLDNGEGQGVCDGGVDINDLLFFLAQFELGNEAADLDDDGVDPAMPDGGTDINDLLFFLAHFESGC